MTIFLGVMRASRRQHAALPPMPVRALAKRGRTPHCGLRRGLGLETEKKLGDPFTLAHVYPWRRPVTVQVPQCRLTTRCTYPQRFLACCAWRQQLGRLSLAAISVVGVRGRTFSAVWTSNAHRCSRGLLLVGRPSSGKHSGCHVSVYSMRA